MGRKWLCLPDSYIRGAWHALHFRTATSGRREYAVKNEVTLARRARFLSRLISQRRYLCIQLRIVLVDLDDQPVRVAHLYRAPECLVGDVALQTVRLPLSSAPPAFPTARARPSPVQPARSAFLAACWCSAAPTMHRQARVPPTLRCVYCPEAPALYKSPTPSPYRSHTQSASVS